MLKSKIVIFLFFLFVIFVPKQVFSQKSYIVEALQGMDTLRVKVVLQPDMEQAGLREKRIQTVVEIKLRQAGIKVKSEDERNSPQENFLYIQVNSLKTDESFFATNITTALLQNAILERNKSKTILATVWETSNIGTVSIAKAGMLIEQISEQVDEFINDWLKANSSARSSISIPDKKLQESDAPPLPRNEKKTDSPFTATYVGGNRLPTVEIFNDTDRTMYFDFGQERMTAYTIPSRGSQKINLSEAGNYKYKASAPRVRSDEGQEMFKTGYAYSWRFYIVTVPR